MTVEEIQKQIKTCESNSKITRMQKINRLNILKLMLRIMSREDYINRFKKEFIEKAANLLEKDETFNLEEDIQSNQSILETYLLESEVAKWANLKEITDDSLYDLKYQAFEYEFMTHKDQIHIERAIELLEISREITKYEERKIFMIKDGFRDILGREVVERYNEIQTVENTFLEEPKTKEEYAMNHQKSLDQIEELYLEDEILDEITYRYSVYMIDQLFEYYQNGISKIELKLKQKKL